MTEKNLKLENINPLDFFGINDVNIEKIRTYFPKIKVVARGNSIKIYGDDDELKKFEQKIDEIKQFHTRYNRLTATDIDNILKRTQNSEIPSNNEGAIVYSTNGRPIKARTPNQHKIVKEFEKNDLIFAVGPAGTGKTYIAIAMAVKALKNREVRRIILSRPAVEAGEKLGFLPGDLKEKLDPYLQALYDALFDMIPGRKLETYFEERVIQIAPLAYMRGRTLSDAVVILDEAQNATINQLKMFLTRMGENSKFIVTGDVTQVDIPNKDRSGLIHAEKKLQHIEGISFVKFGLQDVVRHPIVKKIIERYD